MIKKDLKNKQYKYLFKRKLFSVIPCNDIIACYFSFQDDSSSDKSKEKKREREGSASKDGVKKEKKTERHKVVNFCCSPQWGSEYQTSLVFE